MTESLDRAIGRIEGKLDSLLQRVDRQLKDHGDRIRKIEHGQHRNAGFAAGFGAVVGTAFGAVASYFVKSP